MKNSFKISFYLKKNEPKEDGRCSMMGRISVWQTSEKSQFAKRKFEQTMAQFSTRIYVPVSIWQTDIGRAKGRSKEAFQINSEIDKIVASAHKHFDALCKKHEIVTAEMVKNAMQGIADAQDMLLKTFRDHNEEYRQRIGISRTSQTWKNYEGSYKHLAKFLKVKYMMTDIDFRMLDLDFVRSYNDYLRYDLEYMPNTILHMVIPLRKMIKIAIGRGILTRDPFLSFRPTRPELKQRYLSKVNFDKLLNVEFKLNSNLDMARDMFVFASFTGLAYSDMCNLSYRNIVEEPDGTKWIVNDRQKNKNEFNIPILPIALGIIEKYKDFRHGDKVFWMYSCKTINRHLKTIAEQCGIDQHLTYHTARHTFATQHTLSRGVPIESVSHMMGHSSIRSTQVYAEVTTEKIHRDMTELEEKIKGKYYLANL